MGSKVDLDYMKECVLGTSKKLCCVIAVEWMAFYDCQSIEYCEYCLGQYLGQRQLLS